MRYKNIGSHPVEITGGQMIGTGEEVDLDSEAEADEHNKIYIDEGFFLPLSEVSVQSSSSGKTSKKEA